MDTVGGCCINVLDVPFLCFELVACKRLRPEIEADVKADAAGGWKGITEHTTPQPTNSSERPKQSPDGSSTELCLRMVPSRRFAVMLVRGACVEELQIVSTQGFTG